MPGAVFSSFPDGEWCDMTREAVASICLMAVVDIFEFNVSNLRWICEDKIVPSTNLLTPLKVVCVYLCHDYEFR